MHVHTQTIQRANLYICQLLSDMHALMQNTHTHTHLQENHNRSEAISDHLTSAQHPSINRKTGSAPQGRKQHLENRLKWGFQGWRCAYKCVGFCFIELYINSVYSSSEVPGSNKIAMFIVCVSAKAYLDVLNHMYHTYLPVSAHACEGFVKSPLALSLYP